MCMGKGTMVKNVPRQQIGFESAPDFASDAEIAFAERLRRELEKRYFGRSATPTLVLVPPEKDH